MLALARRIVSGEEDDPESVEAVFARARNAESEAEKLLVDDGWSEVVAGDAETDGGDSDLGDKDAAPNRGVAEPNRSLFSWAEFMAEERVDSRGRRPKPASSSLFEWAMGLEQENKEGPADAVT